MYPKFIFMGKGKNYAYIDIIIASVKAVLKAMFNMFLFLFLYFWKKIMLVFLCTLFYGSKM